MAFQLSPGVNVSEVDLTTVIPSVLTTAGAFAGAFPWGPVNKRVTVDSEITLVNTFAPQGPDANTYIPFLTCASFLAYGNNLKVVRVANSYNAHANTSALARQINNDGAYEYSYLYNNNSNYFGPFAAKYPGALGNSLTVSVADSANTFANWTIDASIAGSTINCASYFPGAPGTSALGAAANTTNDELHIIVVDTGGSITGTKGTVLETWPYLSKAFDGVDKNGNSNYYKLKLFNESKWIYSMDPVDYANTATGSGSTLAWGSYMSAANGSFAVIGGSNTASVGLTRTFPFARGADYAVTDATVQNGYSFFTNKDDVDISLVLSGDANTTTQQYIIDNVVNARQDCVAFLSPPYSAVVNQRGNETTLIQTWLNALSRSTSYAFVDSGWKYMFDKYNNTYRYVPINGDTAGLCVYTDTVRDPWYSPAGLNRGNLKNVVKLAWNPSKTDRDILYTAGVNPVISLQGQGTVLYGDKTLQVKPSAFDRINVRRLFIVLEKAIANAAKYSLFEFNDEFTRAQFVALVTPFLRDIQGRRGITDFKVVCDTTNNTGQVIDSNQFVGDIYIKPARSINYIQLNFVAVRTGVNFTTIVGA
jgi:hypothetical protein